MTQLTDGALLQRVQAGDPSALVALYDRYSSLVYAVAFRSIRNPAEAEDVTQELFMRVWKHPERIDPTCETLHGWMLTASRNRSIDFLRKKGADQMEDLVLPSPFNLGKVTEQHMICERALTLVGEDLRDLLEMAFFKEMTHAEIATATGMPLGTIKSKIRRALADLKIAFDAGDLQFQRMLSAPT